MKNRWSRIAISALILLFAFFVVAWLFKGYSPLQAATFFLAPTPSEIPEIGQPIADAIERFRAKHEKCPKSLRELGIDIDPNFYGRWRYTVSEDRKTCTLATGEYGRYLFEVWWTPSEGWYIDT